MLQRDGERLLVQADMTIPNARRLVEAGETALADGVATVDLSAVSAADSAGIAVLLAWARSVRRSGKTLKVTGASDSLRSLADVYGVAPLLQMS